jgi:hypothetical protein
MDDEATIIIADGKMLSGADNVNILITKRLLRIQGNNNAGINGGNSVVFRTDNTLDRSDAPTFWSLIFINATIQLGNGAAQFQQCQFAGSGSQCGIVYSGLGLGGEQTGLEIQDGTLTGSCGIVVNSGGMRRRKKEERKKKERRRSENQIVDSLVVQL